jgi:nitroreductase
MDTKMLELLRSRKPTRAIATQPVDEEKLQAILEAARLSASCANNQSWRFLVLNEPQSLERGREALSKGNYWAKTAPVLIFGYSNPDLDCKLPGGREYYQFDLGMAVQNILLQASEFGLVARPMAGYSPSKVQEIFGLPEDMLVLIAIAIGYEGDISTLEERHQKTSLAERERKPLEETVSFNQVRSTE